VQLGIGLIIATVGVMFTLDNLHVVHARELIRYWPIGLVALGLAQIAQAQTSARVWSGSMWITVGILMLANRIGLLRVNIWAYWPLLLVFVGGRIFWQSFYAASQAPAVSAGVDSTTSATPEKNGGATASA